MVPFVEKQEKDFAAVRTRCDQLAQYQDVLGLDVDEVSVQYSKTFTVQYSG